MCDFLRILFIRRILFMNQYVFLYNNTVVLETCAGACSWNFKDRHEALSMFELLKLSLNVDNEINKLDELSI